MKIASRYLLPLELLMAVLMLSWGISGWVGSGLLAQTLAGTGQNAEWGLVACGIGGAQLTVCSLEWFAGRRWNCRRLLAVVTARYWIALVSGVVWIYVMYVMVTSDGTEVIFSVSIQAAVAVVFSAWIFAGNLKVSCLLDPKMPTRRLQGEILAEREELLRGQR